MAAKKRKQYWEAYHKSMIAGYIRCGHKHETKKAAQKCAAEINKRALLHHGVRSRG